MFIELDTQRASRAFRNGVVTKPINLLFFVESNSEGDGTVRLQAAKILPQELVKRSGILSRVLNKLAQNPLQQMYQAIEDQGITPGEEVRMTIVRCDEHVLLILNIILLITKHSSSQQ